MKERMSVIVRGEKSLGEHCMMGVANASSNILHFISVYFNRTRHQHTGNFSIYKIHGSKVNQGALLL